LTWMKIRLLRIFWWGLRTLNFVRLPLLFLGDSLLLILGQEILEARRSLVLGSGGIPGSLDAPVRSVLAPVWPVPTAVGLVHRSDR
jgi:hypothetical protein